MKKQIKLFLILSLVFLGQTTTADAFITKLARKVTGVNVGCNPTTAKTGGKDAYECVRQTTGAKDPKFLRAFVKHQCVKSKMKKSPVLHKYCKMAKDKLEIAETMILEKQKHKEMLAKKSHKKKKAADYEDEEDDVDTDTED